MTLDIRRVCVWSLASVAEPSVVGVISNAVCVGVFSARVASGVSLLALILNLGALLPLVVLREPKAGFAPSVETRCPLDLVATRNDYEFWNRQFDTPICKRFAYN